ncbi:unnamed protein product [Closterium sp. NIES-53]
MAMQKERSSSNGSPGTTPTPPPASGLQTEEGTATRARATSSETPANQAAAFDPDMMEKLFSFMSFYEQHQQGAPAQSNNSNNNNATPMSLDDGLGYNLLSVSQLMAKGIHLEADSTTQDFKLYHGKGGLYIGKVVLKNNVFVLDFVPNLGTADSDGIVTFTSWTHPPDLDPDFSPEGFWYSHTIPEAKRTRALATIQNSAAAEPTPATAETISAAAETTLAAAETTAVAAATSTPIAGPSTASAPIDNTPPTPAQQLKPTPREVHRSANFIASFYSNSDLYRRSPGHRAGEDIWHARMGHPSNTVLNNTIRAGVLDKDSLLLTDGIELRRARGTCFSCPEADLPHRPFASHHNPSAPAYAPLEKVYSDILYNRELGQGAYSYTITFIDAATRYVWHLNLPSKDMAFEAFVAWLPQGMAERMNRTLQNTMRKLLRGMPLPNHQWPEAMDHAVMLHNLLSSSSLLNNASPHLLWTGKQGSTKMLRVFGCMVLYRPHTAIAGRFSQRARWGLHLGIERNYKAWKIFAVHSKETVAARDVIFYKRLTLPTYLANLKEDRDPTGGFRGDRAFASAADEADWDEQNVDEASEESGPLPYCSVVAPMDDENPRKSANGEVFYHFADNGFVTPAEVNTNEGERIGPNFIPDPEAGDEAAYPADTTLPRYTQGGLQILGLVTAVHGTEIPKEPATVQQALGGEHREKWHEAMDKELKALEERNTWKVGMYRLTKGTDYILLIVYVDDLLYIGSTNNVTTWFEGELQKDLTLTVSSTVTQYLGLNIQEEEDAIYLNAAKYADTIAKRFALTPTTISTPYRYTVGNNKERSAPLNFAGIRV